MAEGAEGAGAGAGEGAGAGLGPGSRGYELLRRAGWREGRGLGAAEQGPKEPLAVRGNAGRRGVGAAPSPSPSSGGSPSRRKRRRGIEDAGKSAEGRVRASPAARAGGGGAEKERRREKRISEFIYRAFKEEEPEPGGERHSNPLLRKNWRSGTNPLDLDYDESR